MKNFKTIFTVFIIYQITAILILYGNDHSYDGICSVLLSRDFCDDYGVIKYFIFCLVVPGAIALVYWWRKEIKTVIAKICLKIIKIKDNIENQTRETQFDNLFHSEISDFDNLEVIELVKHLCQLSLISAQYKETPITKSFVRDAIISALNTIIKTNENAEFTKDAKQILKFLQDTEKKEALDKQTKEKLEASYVYDDDDED